jgi:hypothetical protein
MNIKQILQQSLKLAAASPDSGENLQFIHRNRSQNFVKTLAAQLREEYRDQKNVFVLSKDFGETRTEFGLNELLYDILVCETSHVASVIEKETLTYITKAIWEIESEFARNSREAIYDFNKLVLGSSENKLFIGPQVSDEEGFLKPLNEVAKQCKSNTYVALLPHPSEWKSKSLDVHCWSFNNGWQKI